MALQTIFLTGGTGKIGTPLLRHMVKEDYRIILLVHEGEKPEVHDPKIREVYGDIREPSGYAPSLEEVDTIVHMAAVTHTNDASKYYDLNSTTTLNLIKNCKKYNVKRFVFISTRAISEDGGDYSKSKFLAERHVKMSGMDWVILRLAEVYGIGAKTGIDMILKDIEKMPFVPIIGKGEYRMAPVHISDVVLSIAHVIKNSNIKHRIYTIAGAESFTFNQLIDKVLDTKKLKRPKIHIPVFLMLICMPILSIFLKNRILAKDQLKRLLCEKSDDISLAVKDLNFKPIKLEEYLKGNAN